MKFIISCITLLLFSVKAYAYEIPNGAILGAKIVNLNSGQVILEHNADFLLYPASNQKIVTTYAALKLLPEEYKFKTELLTDDKNNLYIRFSGDPTLSYGQLAELTSEMYGRNFNRIILDVSAFDDEHYGPGWAQDQTKFCFSAPISASMIDKNCQQLDLELDRGGNMLVKPGAKQFIDVEVEAHKVDIEDPYCEFELASLPNNFYKLSGCYNTTKIPKSLRIAINNPDTYIRDVISSLLDAYQINYNEISRGLTPNNAKPAGAVYSLTLQELLEDMMKNSDNVIAEALFKTFSQIKTSLAGNWKNSSKVVNELLGKELGLKNEQYVILDGSGYSRKDLLSTDFIIGLLTSAYNDEGIKKSFMATFPEAGLEGTLKERFKFIKEGYRIIAKTGSADNASALSGYAFHENGEAYAFSFIFNGFTKTQENIKKLEEEILSSHLE